MQHCHNHIAICLNEKYAVYLIKFITLERAEKGKRERITKFCECYV
jgi:hypothetical protein